MNGYSKTSEILEQLGREQLLKAEKNMKRLDAKESGDFEVRNFPL